MFDLSKDGGNSDRNEIVRKKLLAPECGKSKLINK